MVAFRPDSFGLWYYKVNKMWSVIILGAKIFGLWWSVVFRQTVWGYYPQKTFGILYVIWCILTESGGSYLQAACNFALKIERICQLQCPRDCTAVLPLLSNEHALKSGTFGVPGLVLLGRGTTWHKSGTSREIRDGWQP